MSCSGRNYGIELYRVLLVFGICVLHSISQGIYKFTWAQNALLFCVDGFMFITGYYGVSFKPSKILKLYGIALYTGGVIGLVALLGGYLEDTSWLCLLKTVKNVSH